MCITVFDIVLEGWNLDTKDLTVNTGKSQEGHKSFNVFFWWRESWRERKKKDFSTETLKKIKERKEMATSGQLWPTTRNTHPHLNQI